MKRTLALLLAFALLASILPSGAPEANAAISSSTFVAKTQEFLNDSRWKNGIAWGDSQTPKLSKWSSTGCCAYAADFVAYVYGSATAAWTSSDFTKYTDMNEIRAGDIIHTSNHWFVVLERSGDTFRTAEGNFDDKVRVCSDGWGIKNGKLYNLKANAERTFVYGYHYKFTDSVSTATYSSKKVYHNIDMSAGVLASRTNQQVTSDCAVVSMVTIESFLHGATSAADKKTVYNALISKNKDDNYAYWSNCGYVSRSSINWETVYDNLTQGYPVIVHRPATSTQSQHWAVVAGYAGSTTTLEKDKFIIVDVYHGSGSKDIYTSAAWRGSVSIDRMVTRKNGIAVTALDGIRMAINHPASTHQYGIGHGVYGNVTSNETLTSVQVKVANANTGTVVFNKTVTPNAKSYCMFNLDSQMTFAKWAKGKYVFTVMAKTASDSRTYQHIFEIATGWPETELKQGYRFNFNANGGTDAPAFQNADFGGSLHIPAAIPTREGYTFKGWNVVREGDKKIYCQSKGWCSEAEITAGKYEKYWYQPGQDFNITNVWVSGCASTVGFTFYAQWEVAAPNTFTISYDGNGGSNIPNSQIKTSGVALVLSNIEPYREGYTFVGWSADANATSATYQPGSSFTGDANTTLYAVWKQGCENGAHTYSYTATKAPTTSATGTLTGTCSKCSGTTTVTLPKLSTTDYSYAVRAAATCTATGTGRYTWKTTTYGSFYFDVTIAKTAHSYGAASCTKPATCSTCGATSGSAAGHSYSNGSCTVCGAKDPSYVVDQNAPMIVVDTVSGRAEETVTVTVSMKNNPGFGGMAYDVVYDSAILELVSYETGLGNSICTDSGVGTYANKVNFQYAGTSNVTGDGVLVTLTFKIKASAPEGTALISVVPEEGTFFTYEGRNEKDFGVSCVNGGVKVVKYISGDINGDGKVNNRDAARLLQKLAGWDVACVDATLDVNGDGKVNNRDAARILQYLAGWDVQLH